MSLTFIMLMCPASNGNDKTQLINAENVKGEEQLLLTKFSKNSLSQKTNIVTDA